LRIASNQSRYISTHDDTICGTAWNERGLDSAEIESNIRYLLDNLSLLITFIVLIGAKRIHLAESRCESLVRAHDGENDNYPWEPCPFHAPI
jgi:hypothetical protein